MLTQTLSWRFCLYVNLVIAVPTAIVALRLLVNHRPVMRPRIDLPGVLAASTGLFALVYGFSNAETHSWSAPLTIAALCASAVLLATFVAIERRVRQPLLPLSVVRDRARGGAFISIAFAGSGPFAVFLFLTFYLQRDLLLAGDGGAGVPAADRRDRRHRPHRADAHPGAHGRQAGDGGRDGAWA